MPIVTINGVDIDVPDSAIKPSNHALKIGDPVKLLVKSQYSEPTVCAGVVAGFEMFQSLPTISIAYIGGTTYTPEMRFAHINTKSADKYELVHGLDRQILEIDKSRIEQLLADEVEKKRREMDEAMAKQRFFTERFTAYFTKALAEELTNAAA